ncbi:CoA-transferase [Streptomyces sp. NBC_01396]|uniref:CoA-transferase n=1 Tax=Streptomyces sp. NBC_01396 TaxID=2903852 RepID=UPI0038658D37
MDKLRASAAAAVADIPDGASLAVGGFGLSGVPEAAIRALHEQGATGLEVQQQRREQSGAAPKRPAGVAAFVAGLVLTLAFFAFFPGLPHVIDWGAIIVAVLVGALTRWICRSWMGKRSKESQ